MLTSQWPMLQASGEGLLTFTMANSLSSGDAGEALGRVSSRDTYQADLEGGGTEERLVSATISLLSQTGCQALYPNYPVKAHWDVYSEVTPGWEVEVNGETPNPLEIDFPGIVVHEVGHLLGVAGAHGMISAGEDCCEAELFPSAGYYSNPANECARSIQTGASGPAVDAMWLRDLSTSDTSFAQSWYAADVSNAPMPMRVSVEGTSLRFEFESQAARELFRQQVDRVVLRTARGNEVPVASDRLRPSTRNSDLFVEADSDKVLEVGLFFTAASLHAIWLAVEGTADRADQTVVARPSVVLGQEDVIRIRAVAPYGKHLAGEVRLFDSRGRLAALLGSIELSGTAEVPLRVPQRVRSGVYWLSMRTGDGRTIPIRRLVVLR